MRDFASNVKSDLVVKPAVLSSDENGDSVDLLKFGSCRLSALIGATGDTLSGSVALEIGVEESDDNTTFTPVADVHLSNTVAGVSSGVFAKLVQNADVDQIYPVEYRGAKRYIRPALNFIGTHSNGTALSVLADRGWPKETPV